jgi:hypothetical protein
VALGFVAFIGWWAYGTSDTLQAAVLSAALCSTVAAIGFFGPWYGVHTWPQSKTWGAAIFLAGVIALLFNLSNSFTAMATRNDAREAVRAEIIKARAELEDLVTSPDHASAGALEAAHEAVQVARERRSLECGSARGGRGRRCRQREADLSEAIAALGMVESARGRTVRAEELRAKIAAAPPVNSQSPAVATYARLFQIPDAQALTLSEWLKLGLAAAVELGLAIMIAGGERGRAHHGAQIAQPLKKASKPEAATADDYIYSRRLAVEIGARSTIRDVYEDYRTWSRSERRPALAPDDFCEQMEELCEGTDVMLRRDAGLFVNARVPGAAKLPVKRLGHMTTVGTA